MMFSGRMRVVSGALRLQRCLSAFINKRVLFIGGILLLCVGHGILLVLDGIGSGTMLEPNPYE